MCKKNRSLPENVMGWLALMAARTARGQDYKIDPSISGQSLFEVLRLRLWAFLRGLSWKLRGRRVVLPLFVGRGVSIHQAHLMKLGQGVSIGDHAIIDALSRHGVQIGNGVTIAEFAYLKCSGTLGNLGIGTVIGDNSAIGAYSYIGAAGGVVIGSNVLFGQRVSVHAENHIFEQPGVLIRDQGVTRKGVRIEDDCWIGSHSVILDGVTIGTGAVVAAGSVVRRDVPPLAVVAGVPAQIVRYRGEHKSSN